MYQYTGHALQSSSFCGFFVCPRKEPVKFCLVPLPPFCATEITNLAWELGGRGGRDVKRTTALAPAKIGLLQDIPFPAGSGTAT
jgi:hypothetical protein